MYKGFLHCLATSQSFKSHLILSSSSQTPWLLLLQELFQWLCNFGTSASLRLISLPLALKSSEPLSPLLLSSPSHRLLKQSPQVSLFFSHTKRRTLGRHCCFLLFWFFLSSFLQKKKRRPRKISCALMIVICSNSLFFLPPVYCGRGDRKTAKGKRFNHSFGNVSSSFSSSQALISAPCFHFIKKIKEGVCVDVFW